MNIKTSTLKHFQKLSSGIRGSGILPITDYLKFDDGKITKTALTSFVTFSTPEVTESFLIDEKQLYNLLGNTSSEFITISKKGNKTILSDTQTKLSVQCPDMKEFPAIQEAGDERVALSAEFVDALHMASFFSVEKETIPSVKSFVMVGNKTICASDGFIVFTKPVVEDITVVVEKKVAATVSKMSINKYASVDNYYFFFTDNITFGFAKQEIGFMDMNRVFDLAKDAKPTFTTDSSDFLSFNSLTMQSIENPFINIEKGSLVVSDIALDINLSRPLECLENVDHFQYMPSQMNRILSAISSDQVDFYKGDKRYYIKSADSDFTTLIQGTNSKTSKP